MKRIISERKKGFGYVNLGIMLPSIGVGYRAFISNRSAIDASVIGGLVYYGEIKLLALLYPTQNFYFGGGIGFWMNSIEWLMEWKKP